VVEVELGRAVVLRFLGAIDPEARDVMEGRVLRPWTTLHTAISVNSLIYAILFREGTYDPHQLLEALDRAMQEQT
jgi:hypothetical protein